MTTARPGCTCPICLAALNDDVVTPRCMHAAHAQCLELWLVKGARLACPVCRTPVVPTNNRPITTVQEFANVPTVNPDERDLPVHHNVPNNPRPEQPTVALAMDMSVSVIPDTTAPAQSGEGMGGFPGGF